MCVGVCVGEGVHVCMNMYIRCSGISSIRECCVCCIKATLKITLTWNEVLHQFFLSYIEMKILTSYALCFLGWP